MVSFMIWRGTFTMTVSASPHIDGRDKKKPAGKSGLNPILVRAGGDNCIMLRRNKEIKHDSMMSEISVVNIAFVCSVVTRCCHALLSKSENRCRRIKSG
jgi:hypothetical protein